MPTFYNNGGETLEVKRYKDGAALGGLPRVSEISKVMPNGQLARWQCEKTAEGMDMYGDFEMAYEYMQSLGQKAADAGIEIHKWIEDEIDGVGSTIQTDLQSTVISQLRAFKRDYMDGSGGPWRSEQVILDTELGYGGRCDLNNGKTYIDWKTRDAKPLKSGRLSDSDFYTTYIAQLMAYGCANGGYPERCISVIIDRTTGLFYVKEWNNAEMRDGWRYFNAAHTLYCIDKGYDINLAINNFRKKGVDNSTEVA